MNQDETLKQIELEKNKILTQRTISPAPTTSEWKKRLDEANDAKTIIGLLHYGLDLDMQGDFSFSDRICTYLDYAYGYNNPFSFSDYYRFDAFAKRKIDINGVLCDVHPDEIKRFIARKALLILCIKFFKDTKQGNTWVK
jgi:hypothetical protein